MEQPRLAADKVGPTAREVVAHLPPRRSSTRSPPPSPAIPSSSSAWRRTPSSRGARKLLDGRGHQVHVPRVRELLLAVEASASQSSSGPASPRSRWSSSTAAWSADVGAREANRRFMSSSSGFVSSTATARGSNAIPHFGQVPGSGLTTSGCMGQTYWTFSSGHAGASSSRAMPHLGHGPGPICCTSGRIGQTSTRSSLTWGPLWDGTPGRWPAGCTGMATGTGMPFGMGSAARLWVLSGSARNLSRQCRQQK